MTGIPLLAVVVLVPAEPLRLEECLRSIQGMRNPGGEVEVICVEGRGSPVAARNAGWRSARAPYVLFLDGDTVLRADFVARALCAFHDPSVAVVWGRRHQRYPERSLYHRALDLEGLHPVGSSESCGNDGLFRRAVLARSGGFEEGHVAGASAELCQRIRALGFRVHHVDLPMNFHDSAITRASHWWRRAFRMGRALEEASHRSSGHAIGAHGAVLTGVATLFGLGLLTGSPGPLGTGLAFFTGLVLTTAWRERWRSRSALTLLLYALHLHLQQLPIACGRLASRAAPRGRGLRYASAEGSTRGGR